MISDVVLMRFELSTIGRIVANLQHCATNLNDQFLPDIMHTIFIEIFKIHEQ